METPSKQDLSYQPGSEISVDIIQTSEGKPSSNKKGPTFDNKQRLNRLISDSNKRRTRYNRDLLSAQEVSNRTHEVANNGPDTITTSTLENEQDPQQFSEICDRYSNFNTSSRLINKEMMFNQTVNITERTSKSRKPENNFLEKNKKHVEQQSKTNKDLIAMAQMVNGNSKMWHKQLRTSQQRNTVLSGSVIGGSIPAIQKLSTKAKVNTNLRNSASVTRLGRTKSPSERAKEIQSKVKLGISLEVRLEEEMKQRNTEQVKKEIKAKVNTKYSKVESMLHKNIEGSSPVRNQGYIIGEESRPVKIYEHNKPPMSTTKKVIRVSSPTKATKPVGFEFATATRSANRTQSKGSSETAPTPVTNKSQKNPKIPLQTITLAEKKKGASQSKTSSLSSVGRQPIGGGRASARPTAPTVTNKQNNNDPGYYSVKEFKPSRIGLYTQAARTPHNFKPEYQNPFEQAVTQADKSQNEIAEGQSSKGNTPSGISKHMSKVNSNVSIPRHRKLSNSSTPQTRNAHGKSMIEGANKQNMTHMNDVSDVNIPASNTTDGGVSSKVFPRPRLNQTTVFSKAKEDIMNLDIETIWKEMEEIGRSKQAAHELFQAFQDKYYDKNEPGYFDQSQESPTKRLISMKNATTKHHVIEYRKGITGRYAIQYTTCPEKSYVILPDEGQTDYDKYNDKHAHQFVDKIINAGVERVELQERGKKQKLNPNHRVVTSKSPVRINREHCQRSDLVGSFSHNEEVKVGSPQNNEDSDEPIVVVTTANIYHQQQDKPDIEISRRHSHINAPAIYEQNQQHENDEDSDSFHHEDSIINICSTGRQSDGQRSIIVVEEKLGRPSLASQQPGLPPLPTQAVPVPMAQEEQEEQPSELPEMVPFHSDEQPINMENNSIISTTHDEAIQIFDNEGEHDSQELIGEQEPQVLIVQDDGCEPKLEEDSVPPQEIESALQQEEEKEVSPQLEQMNENEPFEEVTAEVSESDQGSPEQAQQANKPKTSGRRKKRRNNRW